MSQCLRVLASPGAGEDVGGSREVVKGVQEGRMELKEAPRVALTSFTNFARRNRVLSRTWWVSGLSL